MPQVEVEALVPGADADAVFARISDFEGYAEYTDAVREITLRSLEDGVVESTWSVNFRNGILCWSERDHIRPDRRMINFDLLDGDFDELSGQWTVSPDGQDVRVVFIAEFDLGIPSIAEMINPVATRILQENIEAILRGLLGEDAVVSAAEQIRRPRRGAPDTMPTSGAHKWVRKIVILFAVITALLIAGDYGAAAVAEHRVAQQMRDALGLTSDPTVRINGFPFLAQAVAGDYPDVGVDADGISYGVLHLSLQAHLRHTRVPVSAFFSGGAPVTRIDQAEGTVLIDPGDLGGLLGVPDLRVDPVSSAQLAELRTVAATEPAGSATSSAPVDPASMVQLSGTAPGLGEPFAVIASVDVVDGQLQITGRDVQVGSGGALDDLLPGPMKQAILQAFTVKIDPGSLPFGATPTAVRADGGALAISGSTRNLTLNG